jgi:hypothetical protein
MVIILLACQNCEGADDSNACAAQDQHHMSDHFENSRSAAAISKNSATSES